MTTAILRDDVEGGWDRDGIGSGGGPAYIPPKWLDITWTFTEGHPTGILTGFEVGVVSGTVPETDPWLLAPFQVGAAERRAVRAVVTLDPLTNARGCVRALFGAAKGPWSVQGVAQSVGSSSVVVAPQSALDAITSDGILSRAEKPSVITEFKAAENDYLILSARAEAAGITYTELANAWTALHDYMVGLSPAYDNTGADTVIDAAVWQANWQAYFKANSALFTKIGSAPPGVVAGVSGSNLNLTTNASQPTVDGVLRAAGDILLLRGQTTPAQNGIYQVAYTPPAGAASNNWPTTGTDSGTGTYTNGANAYDNSGSPNYTPNDATASSLASPSGSGYEEVIFSGWSGSWTSGQLKLNLSTFCEYETGAMLGQTTVVVSYSKDGGTNWIAWDAFNHLVDGDHALSLDVTGVTPSLLRVKVRANGARVKIVDETGTYYLDLLAGATIKSVYFYVPAVGSGNWYFAKVREVPDGTVWSVTAGTTYGGKTYEAAVDGSNAITLTATTSYSQPFDIPFGWPTKPAAGQKLLIMTVTRGLRVLATGHQGKTYTNPTATATITLKKNGSAFGTVQFATNGAFSIPSVTQTDFAAGDIFTAEAPASQDATFQDFGVTIKAQTL